MTDQPAPQLQEMPFQAEVQQLLHLVVHSLYTNREVFLRELIANASDALDKARFLAVTNPAIAERMGPPEIRIEIDKQARTLTVEDNGIGMTRDEIAQNLGTIARSGTAEFLERLKAEKAEGAQQLIGQFGVGFYSAFTIADRVDVESRSVTSSDAKPVLWRSSGKGSFTITDGEREHCGTRVVVHVGKDHDEYLEEWRIDQLIKKYSDFVSYPIKRGDKTINQSSALWTRPRNEITDEQYNEFFQHVQGGFGTEKPLARMHFSSDAPIQYHALLYVPDQAPFDLLMDTRKKGIRLYAKRVFVMDSCEKLAPPYLQFLRGVVDSEDLSLNVSREMLQDERTLETIQKAIVKHTLKTLEEMAEHEPDKYKTFGRQFGRLFRLGVSGDPKNRDAIAKLLRYPSTKTADDELISLSTYVSRMAEGQKAIYYLTGPSLAALRSSPHLEVFRRKGIEVLLMADAVDEWVVGALSSFEQKPLESVAHGALDLSEVGGETKADEPEASSSEVEAVVSAVKRALGDKVKDVRASQRLTESVAVLVSDTGELSPHMERVMRMLDREVETPKRILEINPAHPFVKNFASLAQRAGDSEQVTMFAELLLDQAMLADGVITDPNGLLKRMQKVMTAASEVLVKRQ